MSLPFQLPDWVPWWAQLAILVVAVLVAGTYLLMPFSVFGLKARIEALDERLDEIQADIRALTHRLPDPEMRSPASWRRQVPDDDGYVPPRAAAAERAPPPPRPPLPPAPMVPERLRDADRPPVPRAGRAEPQIRWPRD